MRTHYLKTLPPYWERVQTGQKKFEVRKNDRDFQVDDTVNLVFYDPENENSHGGVIMVKITYIINGGQFGLKKGFCVFGFEVVQESN